MRIAVSTICVKVRPDRQIIYYVRPLLDYLDAFARYQPDETSDHIGAFFVWSNGYARRLLEALGAKTHHIDCFQIARQFFEGGLWLNNPSYFAPLDLIQNRYPAVYAVWVSKVWALKQVLERDTADAVVHVDAGYPVSYNHRHSIESYLAAPRRLPDWANFARRLAELLRSSGIVLCGERPMGKLTPQNAADIHRIRGCFIAIRRDAIDEFWNHFLDRHREIVRLRRMREEEPVLLLAAPEASVVSPGTWDVYFYGDNP